MPEGGYCDDQGFELAGQFHGQGAKKGFLSVDVEPRRQRNLMVKSEFHFDPACWCFLYTSHEFQDPLMTHPRPIRPNPDASETLVLDRIRISDTTLQAVVDECLVKQAELSGRAVDGPRLMGTPEARSLALRYAFEGCALSALVFSAPEATFGEALRECTQTATAARFHDPAFIAWVQELRAVAFVASVEDEKAAMKASDNETPFDIESRVHRFMNALV